MSWDEQPTTGSFSHVAAHIDYHLTQTVMWRLKPSVTDRRGMFTVEASLEGEEFHPITGRVDGLFARLPLTALPFAGQDKAVIRVRYDGERATHVSPPAPARMRISERDRGIASEMMRRQQLTLAAYSGVPGMLLKRRVTGDPCPLCVDTRIGSAGVSNCPDCLGTGLSGGYYPGVPYLMEIRGAPNATTVDDPVIGPMEPGNAVQALAIHEHWLERGDVWAREGTGERFVVQEVAPATVYKDLVVSVQLVLRREDTSPASPLGQGVSPLLPPAPVQFPF